MEKLRIENEDSPRVIFDPEYNIFEISGQSLPENAIKTYQPILDWVDKNLPNEQMNKIDFTFKLDYINSSSAKMLTEFFKKLEVLKQNGMDIRIIWLYDIDDEEIESEGEDFSTLTTIPFVLQVLD